jgi:hypothetical protein
VLGALMRRDGLPIACEVWPGNTADVDGPLVVGEDLMAFRIRESGVDVVRPRAR